MESAPHTPNQSTQETHVLRPDEGVEMPPTLENPKEPRLHIRENILRPFSKTRAMVATVAASLAMGAAMPAQAKDKYGLEALGRVAVAVAGSQGMERLGVPVLIKVTTEGGFVFVLNTNMQVAPEMHADDPEVKKYLQEEGLQIGRSPLLIRVASNPGSGIQFQPDTRAVVITRNATGIDIHRYFMRCVLAHWCILDEKWVFNFVLMP
jgi:hypothetical protein